MNKFVHEVIIKLKNNSSKKNIEGMRRFAIQSAKCFGVGNTKIREIVKELRKKIDKDKRNKIAQELWNYGYHETKTMAGMIATKEIGWKTTEKWISKCENWAQVDGLCLDLLWKLPNADKKAIQFSKSKKLWRKRTGFAMMAVLAVRYKNELNSRITKEFFKAIERESEDKRNFIKKAVNWALRQIGKSAPKYYSKALGLSKKLSNSVDKTERWIGKDAYRELIKRKK